MKERVLAALSFISSTSLSFLVCLSLFFGFVLGIGGSGSFVEETEDVANIEALRPGDFGATEEDWFTDRDVLSGMVTDNRLVLPLLLVFSKDFDAYGKEQHSRCFHPVSFDM